MRINHHLTVDVNWQSRWRLSKAGLGPLQPDELGLATFDIAEDDPRWPAVSKLVRPLRMLDVVSTQFSRDELLAAKCCAVNHRWQDGYPQPEDDDGYLTQSYDTSDYCETCGMGLVQKAPFRMKGEPKWGKRSFLHLHWIEDEVFTTPETWKAVFEPLGVKHLPVWFPQKDKPLERCVQLVIEARVDLTLPAGHPSERCGTCGRTRWPYFYRGLFPGPVEPPTSHLFKSKQYFGSGHASHQQIMVSAQLYKEIEARKLTGLGFAACISC